MPVVVGLTGGIATGKSSVSKIWSRAGAVIVDADAEARAVLACGSLGLWLIRQRFGKDVIQADGGLDRAALGRVIFSDEKARAALNARTHPLIIARMVGRLLWAILVEMRSVVVLDTPLLFETRSLLPFCQMVVVVYCSEEQQFERGITRNGMADEDMRRRIQAQIGIEEKRGLADFVVDNSGEKHELEVKAMEVFRRVKPSVVSHLAFCGILYVAYFVSGYQLFRMLRKWVRS